MSSIKDRQRAAARARLEKEMAERAEAARKRRQKRAIIGAALVVVVIAGGAYFLVTALRDDDKPATNAAAAPPGTVACTWTPETAPPDGSQGPKIVDVGTPPPNAANTGKLTMTIDSTLGPITATVDKSKTPCTAAAFEFLSSKKFWDGTKCHRMTTQGIKVLQCGDPSAKGKGYRDTDGTGGPSFRYAEENKPPNAADGTATYPAGSIAMAKTQQPGSTGSQFFITYAETKLPGDYTLLGTVSQGMDVVNKVAKGGVDDSNGPGDGHPKTEIGIKTLTLAPA
ncbi:peptidylprolyl isomerase [Actinoplanes sp. NPDC051633]|uniref:peptidylprolyl isomerase n=1 Tax=Actinoplanes sp. NPDC051633 TaxID=3155670 RepID=UPI0034417F87